MDDGKPTHANLRNVGDVEKPSTVAKSARVRRGVRVIGFGAVRKTLTMIMPLGIMVPLDMGAVTMVMVTDMDTVIPTDMDKMVEMKRILEGVGRDGKGGNVKERGRGRGGKTVQIRPHRFHAYRGELLLL